MAKEPRRDAQSPRDLLFPPGLSEFWGSGSGRRKEKADPLPPPNLGLRIPQMREHSENVLNDTP